MSFLVTYTYFVEPSLEAPTRWVGGWVTEWAGGSILPLGLQHYIMLPRAQEELMSPGVLQPFPFNSIEWYGTLPFSQIFKFLLAVVC